MTRTSMLLIATLLTGCGGAAADLDEREYADDQIVAATGGASSEMVAAGGAIALVATGGVAVMATGGSVALVATGGAMATGGAPAATGGAATGGSGTGGSVATGGYQATGGAAPRTGNWTLCDKLPVCNDQRGECFGDPIPTSRETGRGCRGGQFRCGTVQGMVVMPDDPAIIPQLVALVYMPVAGGGIWYEGARLEADRYAAAYCSTQQ